MGERSDAATSRTRRAKASRMSSLSAIGPVSPRRASVALQPRHVGTHRCWRDATTTPDVWLPWASPMSLMRSPDGGAAGESFRGRAVVRPRHRPTCTPVAIGIGSSGRVGTIGLPECDRRAASAWSRTAELGDCTSTLRDAGPGATRKAGVRRAGWAATGEIAPAPSCGPSPEPERTLTCLCYCRPRHPALPDERRVTVGVPGELGDFNERTRTGE